MDPLRRSLGWSLACFHCPVMWRRLSRAVRDPRHEVQPHPLSARWSHCKAIDHWQLHIVSVTGEECRSRLDEGFRCGCHGNPSPGFPLGLIQGLYFILACRHDSRVTCMFPPHTFVSCLFWDEFEDPRGSKIRRGYSGKTATAHLSYSSASVVFTSEDKNASILKPAAVYLLQSPQCL